MKFSPTFKSRIVRMAKAKIMELASQVNEKEGTYWSSLTESGSFNRFVKLTENWGVKFSDNPARIAANYKRQRRAARYGLGPIAGCLLKVGGFYGYITQIAQTNHNQFFTSDEIVEYPKHVRVVKDLFRLTGFKFGDSHAYNFGSINDKPVCIDFDDVNSGDFDDNFPGYARKVLTRKKVGV